jgi:hypothetical protein
LLVEAFFFAGVAAFLATFFFFLAAEALALAGAFLAVPEDFFVTDFDFFAGRFGRRSFASGVISKKIARTLLENGDFLKSTPT